MASPPQLSVAPANPIAMPVFPLRPTPSPYSPYSPSRFHIDKRCQHRCSWKCCSIALILLSVALTAMLAYFGGEFSPSHSTFILNLFINWKQTRNLCLGKFTLSDLKRKIRTWTGIRTSDLRISSPALYHLSYPGSHASSCSNLPLEADATLARRCGHDTICHLLTTSELTYYYYLKKISNLIWISYSCKRRS